MRYKYAIYESNGNPFFLFSETKKNIFPTLSEIKKLKSHTGLIYARSKDDAILELATRFRLSTYIDGRGNILLSFGKTDLFIRLDRLSGN